MTPLVANKNYSKLSGEKFQKNLPTSPKSIQIIEREEIQKLRSSKTKLMLDE
jgi:hypothetical protein